MIRLILCDDEALALERLGDLLDQVEDVEIVGTFADGRALLDRIADLRPDVILLDIEMPGLDGFDVVEELMRRQEIDPLIVFATAYPHFAVSAFETGAIDFLTKPVRIGRLETMLDRARTAIADRSARQRLEELSSQLDTLRRVTETRGEEPHLWIPSRGELVRVSLDRIDWVCAEAEYVRIVVGPASYLHREPLKRFVDRLDATQFVRVHRSLIVNRTRIASLRRGATGSYRLVATDGTELPVGRSYRRIVREALGLAI